MGFAQHNLEWSEAPSPEGFIPIQPHAQLHFCSACSPLTQFVSARTSTSHTSPPSRSSEVRLTRRRAIRTHTAHIMENRNRTSCMYLCPRLFAQGNCPHSASSRIASMPTLMATARAAVARTARGRHPTLAAAPHRRRDVCTPNGRPPAMHNPPHGARSPWTSHTHTCPRASTSC